MHSHILSLILTFHSLAVDTTPFFLIFLVSFHDLFFFLIRALHASQVMIQTHTDKEAIFTMLSSLPLLPQSSLTLSKMYVHSIIRVLTQ